MKVFKTIAAVAASMLMSVPSYADLANGPTPPATEAGQVGAAGATTFLAVAVTDAGKITRKSPGVKTVQRTQTGVILITFTRTITTCFWTPTLGLATFSGPQTTGLVSAVGKANSKNALFVITTNVNGTFTNLPFIVVLTCFGTT